MKFHFIYHDGSELVFEATSAKHFTGHVVLTDAELIYDVHRKGLLPKGKKFARLNLALNGNLFGMWPEEEEKEPVGPPPPETGNKRIIKGI